jgi:hypothetical protein
MTDNMSTPPYSNIATTYLAPVCTLAAVSLALVIARIHTRLSRTNALYLDDWLILVAEVSRVRCSGDIHAEILYSRSR